MKVNPLADWTLEEVWHYIRSRGLAYNPLHDKGFASIGDTMNTRAIGEGDAERAGRFMYSGNKTECGMHAHQARMDAVRREALEKKEPLKLPELPCKECVDVSPDTFEGVVLEAQKPVLVELFSPLCGHCQHFAPEFDRVAAQLAGAGRVLPARMDIFTHALPQAALDAGFKLAAYPTIFLWRPLEASAGRKPLRKYKGAKTADALLAWVDQVLAGVTATTARTNTASPDVVGKGQRLGRSGIRVGSRGTLRLPWDSVSGGAVAYCAVAAKSMWASNSASSSNGHLELEAGNLSTAPRPADAAGGRLRATGSQREAGHHSSHGQSLDIVIALKYDTADEGVRAWLRAVLAAVSSADLAAGPVLLHCRSGRDRTGVATAAVLALLGVPDSAIVAEFLLSSGAEGANIRRALAGFCAAGGAAAYLGGPGAPDVRAKFSAEGAGPLELGWLRRDVELACRLARDAGRGGPAEVDEEAARYWRREAACASGLLAGRVAVGHDAAAALFCKGWALGQTVWQAPGRGPDAAAVTEAREALSLASAFLDRAAAAEGPRAGGKSEGLRRKIQRELAALPAGDGHELGEELTVLDVAAAAESPGDPHAGRLVLLATSAGGRWSTLPCPAAFSWLRCGELAAAATPARQHLLALDALGLRHRVGAERLGAPREPVDHWEDVVAQVAKALAGGSGCLVYCPKSKQRRTHKLSTLRADRQKFRCMQSFVRPTAATGSGHLAWPLLASLLRTGWTSPWRPRPVSPR
ncbi:unnamed protein product [Prorocentrum cordatum]|uniref:Thioredoxin domain-containing protein n=1 Tax=Prorocentrum cordatum TaxID=2364126 RepID=A0ABN9VS30_9DINO|nr:unnamed protein product [Polarella glacialis]